MNRFFIVFISSLVSLLFATEPVIHLPPRNSFPAPLSEILRDYPEGEEIVNPAEFGRTDGVFLAWAGWAHQLTADIAYAVSQEYQVYLLVPNLSVEILAYDYLLSQSVNMDNVSFIQVPGLTGSSIWIRDYAPFFIKEDGNQAIDDFVYGTYIGDDLISYDIAENFNLPIYSSSLMHHGGNHISDGNGMGFFSSNIYYHNPTLPRAEVNLEFQSFFGIDSLIVVDPMQGDGTGHIDMFCKLLSDTLFIVGEYDEFTECFPGDRERLNEIADYFSGLTNLDGRRFAVERIPMPPYTYGGAAGTINYTYTNSLIINDLVLVPTYGFDLDEEALQIYQLLMPDHTIIGIDSAYIIEYWGAVHCVTNEYFRESSHHPS
ncbi:MAG: agmatine deiminase family protein [Candidatus Cloacimonetes bacterium]|nr:agmatine deiminase family protein [Candidatus Cloacimonadota bacterium]